MSKNVRILVRAYALAIGVATVTGCGQKGDLVLPTEPAAARRATLGDILTPGSAVPSMPPVTPTSTR